MNLEIDLKDINGTEIVVGSRVCAYSQQYEEVSRTEYGGVSVVMVDHTKPKPIKDVPLFIGLVTWNSEQLAFELAVEKVLTEWANPPSWVRMGGGHYTYEVIL